MTSRIDALKKPKEAIQNMKSSVTFEYDFLCYDKQSQLHLKVFARSCITAYGAL
jgi:hypothetical protein